MRMTSILFFIPLACTSTPVDDTDTAILGTLSGLGCFAESSPPNSPMITGDLTNVTEPSLGPEGRGDKREDRVQDFTRFWLVEVTGTVVRVQRLNLDKSGKNPKWMISFWMDCEEVEPEKLPQGFLLEEKEWKV
jgi:hypothetical protein